MKFVYGPVSFHLKKKKNFSATHTIRASDNHLISLKKKNV